MKTYSGNKNSNEGGPGIVIVTEIIEDIRSSKRTLNPTRSQVIRNYSLDGFRWGYAQLAIALLLDLGYAEWAVSAIYQQFKFEVVANLPPNWVKTETELRFVADKLLKSREK